MTENHVDTDESELVNGLVNRDEAALVKLLRTYGPKLKGWLVARFAAVLDPVEIDEALSVTAFNAWRFADRFDSGKAPLQVWLIGIARNAARGILRGEQKHRLKHLEYLENYDPASADEIELSDDQVDAVVKAERIEDLNRSIAELPSLQKAIIEADLAANGHADDDRLASIHNTTKNSIQVSRHKAIRNLRQTMSNLGYNVSGRKNFHE